MNESDTTWALERVKHISGLSKPTANQKLLVELVELDQTGKPDSQEKAALNALIKAEKLLDKAEKAVTAAITPVNNLKEKSRKLENKQRFVLGGLVLGVLQENSRMREWVLSEIQKRPPDKASMEAMTPLLAEIKSLESSSAAEPSTSPESGTPERQSIMQQARNIHSGSGGVANT